MPFAVGYWAWQHEAVPQPKGDKKPRNAIEHQAPRITYAATEQHLQIACHHYKEALAEDCGQTVESASYPDEPSLLVLVKTKHVETVCRNVVSGTAESHQPEETQRALKPEVGGNGERHAAKRSPDQQLHGDDPPAFCLYNVDKRAPQRLYDPRQIKPRSIESDFRVGKSQLLIKHERDGHYGHIRQAFGEIKRRHPAPRILFQFTIHNSQFMIKAYAFVQFIIHNP